jgi:uncharacterized protein (DUF885 family)
VRATRASAVGSAAALFVAAGLAACGGGSSGISKPELITKADAICQVGQRRFAEIQAVPATTAKLATEQTSKLIEALKLEIAQLRKLKAPSDLEADYQAYVAARQKVLTYLEQGLAAAKRHDAKGFGQAKQTVADTGPERLKLAKAVGLKTCSNPAAAQGSSG